MLFVIFIVLLIVGVVLYALADAYTIGEWGVLAGVLLIGLSGLAVLTSIGMIAYAGITAEDHVIGYEQRKAAIEVKIDSELYKDEFGLFDKLLVDEIKV